MSAPGLTSPIRSETFENLQLNAGIFIKNFATTASSATDAATLKTAITNAISAGTNILGATRGGGTFTATREIRTPEVDGMRYPFKGSDFVDSVDAYLSTTLIEVTPDSISATLGNANVTTSGKVTTIKMHTAIETTDYMTDLCWIGDIADGRLVMIVLKNALNTSDFTLTFTDKGEGTLAAEFHARQGSVSDYDYAPFEIVYFDTDNSGMGEIIVTSAAGTNVGETALSTENTLASGQKYVYKVGTTTTAPSIGYKETPDYSWTQWNGTDAISVGVSANNKKATIAVIDSNGKAVKVGTVTLTVKTV